MRHRRLSTEDRRMQRSADRRSDWSHTKNPSTPIERPDKEHDDIPHKLAVRRDLSFQSLQNVLVEPVNGSRRSFYHGASMGTVLTRPEILRETSSEQEERR